MIGIPETCIIVISFSLAVIALILQKEVTKSFKVLMIFLLVCLAIFQYNQIYNTQNENKDLSNKLDKSGKQVDKLTDEINKLQSIIAKSKRRPVIDIEKGHNKNRDKLYIVNKGLEPAYDIQVIPLTGRLNQKHISILGNSQEEKEFIGTLFFNDISPFTQLRVRVYFRDSSSIRYKWEFLINRHKVKSILRQHFNKLPNGKIDYENPVVEFKSGKYY